MSEIRPPSQQSLEHTGCILCKGEALPTKKGVLGITLNYIW